MESEITKHDNSPFFIIHTNKPPLYISPEFQKMFFVTSATLH